MIHIFTRSALVLTAIVLAAMLIVGEASGSEDFLEGEARGISRECTDSPPKEVVLDGYAAVIQPSLCNESVASRVC